MFRMKNKLNNLYNANKEVKFALVGAGKMGKGLVNQLSRIKGLTSSVVIDEKPEKAMEALISSGVRKSDITTSNNIKIIENSIKNGMYVVSDDYSIACKLPDIKGVVDATGNPPFGAILAMEAIENRKHTIMLNVECDAVIGPYLYNLAKKKNVIYTGSAGDEPGAIMELADFALGAGFKLLAVGKGKNNPLNYYITEDDVREEALSKGLYPKMLAGFIDGTNTMIELTSAANALGFVPDVIGCHGPTTTANELGKLFSLKEQGGILNNYKTVDFAFGVAPGVYAIVTSDSDEVHDLMKYLKMGDGPNYAIYRPYHLTSLETPITIYNAIVEKESTIVPACGQVSDTVTVAKRDLKAGEILEGIGGKSVFGTITSHADQKNRNLLPIAMITKKTKLKVDVKKDELITLDMVELDEDHIITKLRRKQDKLGL